MDDITELITILNKSLYSYKKLQIAEKIINNDNDYNYIFVINL